MFNLGDMNIIDVDWSKGAGAPYYQATANIRLVAREIVYLLKTLQVGTRATNSNWSGLYL